VGHTPTKVTAPFRMRDEKSRQKGTEVGLGEKYAPRWQRPYTACGDTAASTERKRQKNALVAIFGKGKANGVAAPMAVRATSKQISGIPGGSKVTQFRMGRRDRRGEQTTRGHSRRALTTK